MSGFDFNEVKEMGKFVGYGINHDVTIIGVKNGTSANGVPFIEISFKPTGEKDDNPTTQKVYMSDQAKNISMVKLMNIHQAVGKLDAIKGKAFNTVEELAAGLNSLWSGRRLRLKLSAREWLGEKDGKPAIRVSSELPIRDFCEAIEPGGEMFPIKDADTQLVFDEQDKWDWKRYEGEVPGADPGSTKTDDDDLPF